MKELGILSIIINYMRVLYNFLQVMYYILALFFYNTTIFIIFTHILSLTFFIYYKNKIFKILKCFFTTFKNSK